MQVCSPTAMSLRTWMQLKASSTTPAPSQQDPQPSPIHSSPLQQAKPIISTLFRPRQDHQDTLDSASAYSSDNESIHTSVTASNVLGRPNRAGRGPASQPRHADDNRRRRENGGPQLDDLDLDDLTSHDGARTPTKKALSPTLGDSFEKDWDVDFASGDGVTRGDVRKLVASGSEYARPAASEWRKYYAIATYRPGTNMGVLQLYKTAQDTRPGKVLDLHNCSSISKKSACSEPDASSTGSIHELVLSFSSHVSNLAADTAAECSGWTMALSMMVPKQNGYGHVAEGKRGGGLVSERYENARVSYPGAFFKPELVSPEDDGAMRAVQAENHELREIIRQQQERFQDSERHESASGSGMDLETIVKTFNESLQKRTADILEAIWSAHTTAERTTTVAHAPAMHLEQAIVELTESMEMRTSKIARMVHDLLNRASKAPTAAVSSETAEVSEGSPTNAVEAEEASSAVVQSLRELHAEQKVSEEAQAIIQAQGTQLIAAAAETNTFLGELTKISHGTLEGVSHMYDGIQEKVDKVGSEITTSIVDFKTDLKESIATHFYDHQQTLSALVTIVNERGVPPAGESASSNDDLINAKVDNILEVIDFVNKSQCRLVALLTDKQKQQSKDAKASTDEKSSDALRASIAKLLDERLATLSSTFASSRSVSADESARIYTEILQSQQTFFKSLTDQLAASDQQQNRAQDMRERRLFTLDLCKEQLHEISTRLSGISRDSNSRHDHMESWMNRNNDLLKHVQKGVQEIERTQRKSDVAAVLTVKAEAQIESIAESLNVVRAHVLSSKEREEKERLDEHASIRSLFHELKAVCVSVSEPKESGYDKARTDKLESALADMAGELRSLKGSLAVRARSDEIPQTLTLQETADHFRSISAQFTSDVNAAKAEKESLAAEITKLRYARDAIKADVAELEQKRSEVVPVLNAREAVAELEKDLQGRIAGLVGQVKRLVEERNELVGQIGAVREACQAVSAT
ncbi:hypothetical protein HK101_002056 [Irineochytrium annulatum]|nr:hypothetical protein HK101_002056 [Irineochytrium annulatum]